MATTVDIINKTIQYLKIELPFKDVTEDFDDVKLALNFGGIYLLEYEEEKETLGQPIKRVKYDVQVEVYDAGDYWTPPDVDVKEMGTFDRLDFAFGVVMQLLTQDTMNRASESFMHEFFEVEAV